MQCACIPGMSLAKRLKATKPLPVSSGLVTCTYTHHVYVCASRLSFRLDSSKLWLCYCQWSYSVILETCCPSLRCAAYLDKSYPDFDQSNRVFSASALHVPFDYCKSPNHSQVSRYEAKMVGLLREAEWRIPGPAASPASRWAIMSCACSQAMRHDLTQDSRCFPTRKKCCCLHEIMFLLHYLYSLHVNRQRHSTKSIEKLGSVMQCLDFALDSWPRHFPSMSWRRKSSDVCSRRICQCCNQGHFLSSMLASLDLWEHRKKVEASKNWVFSGSTIPRKHSAALAASGVPRHRYSQLQRQAGMTMNSGSAPW